MAATPSVKRASSSVRYDRIRGALWGIYIGDAVAMPAHWYYDVRDLRETYGLIKGYIKPVDKKPGSILGKSNLYGAGRSRGMGAGKNKLIVGRLILKGKEKYWKEPDWFYHRGMSAGENTLEALVSRVITRSVVENKGLNQPAVFKDYIALMTTKDAHNDTYAATAHRMFFANLDNGLPLEKCADNDGHNTDSTDGIIPGIAASLFAPDKTSGRKAAVQAVGMFRESTALPAYTKLYSDILHDLIGGATDSKEHSPAELLRSVIAQYGKSMRYDVKKDVEADLYEERRQAELGRKGYRKDPMSACYLNSNFPAMLYFAYKYADSPAEAMLANANAGGENVARGSLLGAVIGAAYGMDGWGKLGEFDPIKGLHACKEIGEEVESFVAALEGAEEEKTCKQSAGDEGPNNKL